MSRSSLLLSIYEPPGTTRLTVIPENAPAKGPCKLPAPKAKATLNGAPLERQRGKYAFGDLMYDRDCILEFTVASNAIPRQGSGVSLQITDDSATWMLEVPTAFETRSFTLVKPSDGVLRRGKPVVLRWSPASDQMDVRGIGVELYPATGGPGSGTAIRNLEVRDDELSFTLPSNAGDRAWAGPSFLRFLGGRHVTPKLRRCPVRTCTVSVDFAIQPLAVTVGD
jgi:hypothetical protein